MDYLTPDQRSANMGRVRGKDTQPELAVRRALHAMGYRFRLHRRDLPGTPDIVLPRYRLVLFVHGCFWHRHADCPRCTTPRTRREFWEAKFAANVERDRRHTAALEADGWTVRVLWECKLRPTAQLQETLSGIVDDGVRATGV
ncbi:very short patch repair endonuclease [Acetobacter conturbans]|uniref:Very short patch repair endonuclease n=1 Tax=Acetobacter conturbans TaxID=1737472 RepID=A0ABX0K2K1_9PROT|nr:very short patch repair endonuclease [Acetobacter conturbans]NHN89046.1 DNA mismatch endonuclease Vsr [Acetobacter conturbans]